MRYALLYLSTSASPPPFDLDSAPSKSSSLPDFLPPSSLPFPAPTCTNFLASCKVTSYKLSINHQPALSTRLSSQHSKHHQTHS